MPMYTDATDTQKITTQIEAVLKEPQAAGEVLATIAELCVETDVAQSVQAGLTKWLALLNDTDIMARAAAGTSCLVLYPSGETGPGGSDRLLMSVSATEIDVLKAFQAPS